MILSASFELSDSTMWENRGLFYGDGVFETMRSCAQHIPLWDLHYQRLQNSLKWLQIEPPDKAHLYNVIVNSLNEHNDWVLRLTLFRHQTKRGYQPTSDECHWLLSGSQYKSREHPQRLVIANQPLSPQVVLDNHKHLNRLPQVLLSKQLNDQPHADDLLVLDTQQRVIETSCQNIILVKDGRLTTPDLHHCGVAGITLNWLRQKMPVVSESIGLADLKVFDAVMTCNAVHGFRYVQSIDTLADYSISHPICDKITGMWREQFLQSLSP